MSRSRFAPRLKPGSRVSAMNHASAAGANASANRPLCQRTALPIQVEALQVARAGSRACCHTHRFLGIVLGETDPRQAVTAFVSNGLTNAAAQIAFSGSPNQGAIPGPEYPQRSRRPAQVGLGAGAAILAAS